MSRNGAGDEAVRDLPCGIVVIGDEIFKLIAAHALIQVDAVHAAHHLAASCTEVLRPELWNQGHRVFILEGFCPAEYRKRLFFIILQSMF